MPDNADQRAIKVTMKSAGGDNDLWVKFSVGFVVCIVVGVLLWFGDFRFPSLAVDYAETETLQVTVDGLDDVMSDEISSHEYAADFTFWGFLTSNPPLALAVALGMVGLAVPFAQLLLMAVVQYPSTRRKKTFEYAMGFFCYTGKWPLVYFWFVTLCASVLRMSQAEVDKGSYTNGVSVELDGNFELAAHADTGSFFLLVPLVLLLLSSQVVYFTISGERDRLVEVAVSNRGKGGSGDASKSLSAFATKHWGDALGGSAAVGSLLAHCLTACYLCCTVAMFVGVFAQSYEVQATIEGKVAQRESHSLWSGNEKLSQAFGGFEGDNAGLRWIAVFLVFGMTAVRQAVFAVVWLVPLDGANRARAQAALKVAAGWAALEPYLCAFFLLRNSVHGIMQHVGGRLVSEYGLSIVVQPVAVHMDNGIVLGKPVLALLVAAIANEALLITAIALGQTQKEELTKHQFAAGSA